MSRTYTITEEPVKITRFPCFGQFDKCQYDGCWCWERKLCKSETEAQTDRYHDQCDEPDYDGDDGSRDSHE
jgi:hypothetical protein